MASIPIFQVDAFADRQFTGNPAAVCPLEAWLTDSEMQSIAAENNLAETAFFIASGEHYELRWFTPTVEVDLCGHATLATAHVLWNEMGERGDSLSFNTRSGVLTVTRSEALLCLNLPAEPGVEVTAPADLIGALGQQPQACFFNQDYLLVFDNETEIRDLNPDFRRLSEVEARGVIVTAPGNEKDFVCRFFAPQVGIDEDPVTGSAFTKLVPYWSQRFKKSVVTARQISTRGGDVWCESLGDRVEIKGHACTYLRGNLQLG